jgi:hypothetical protein
VHIRAPVQFFTGSETEGELCARLREWATLTAASSSAANRIRGAMFDIILSKRCSSNRS